MHANVTFHKKSPAPVRALIFDMDGTILDTRAYHMAAWRELVARHGLTHEHYLVAENGFGKTNRAIFESWFGLNPNGISYEMLSEEKEAIFRGLIAGRERPRPGLIELLSWARRRNVRVALATSGPRANAEFLLADTGIALHFDTLLCAGATTRSKPHPEPFIDAAARLGVPPQQAVVFEDSPHGFLAAVRAGMRLVAIAERNEDLTRIKKWTPYIYQDFRGVPVLLDRWNGSECKL